MVWKLLLVMLLLVNGIGAIFVFWDKSCAKRGKWRVAERTLFLFCILGGCPGVYAAMRMARHKTLHKRFMWGIPAIFIMQLMILGFLLYRFSLQ